jgi:hypothetical protein
VTHFTIKTSTTHPFWAQADVWQYTNGCQSKKLDSKEFTSMKGYTKAITMAKVWARRKIDDYT